MIVVGSFQCDSEVVNKYEKNVERIMMREMKIHLAPQEPTSSFLRSGANIGKRELQDEEEEDVDVQGGQGGRRSQEKRLMGAEGVAHNLAKTFLQQIYQMH